MRTFGAWIVAGAVLMGAEAAKRPSIPGAGATALRDGLGVLVQPASDEGERTRAALQLPPGVRAELWAAHPLLSDPVAISFDGQGRLYVAEHHRNRHGTEDNREHRYWLEDDFASRTIEDRLAFMQKWAAAGKKPMSYFTEIPDRLVCVEDRDGDGRAETSRVLATFSEPLDGANVGVLARHGTIWVTCIPHLWKFHDDGSQALPLVGEKVFSGFGVKFSFHGHDMHGLVQGPDGRIYWSIGDRGYHVRTRENQVVADAWRGAVFRSDPDGANFEVYCTGLRNPQELVFDDLGNLITVDNDNDASDEQPRLLHVVQGADYGWHGGNLWIDEQLPAMAPGFRRPWFEDGLWQARFDGQPAWVMPPVAHLSNGPCGLTREPGVTLMPERWRGAYFLTDWRGGRSSPVIAFNMEPRGNGFVMTRQEDFLSGMLPTDVEFGPDGRLYVVDMVAWELAPGGGRRAGRGSVFALSSDVPAAIKSEVATMRTWFAEGFAQLPDAELVARLAHGDYRIRLEAQLALAARDGSVAALQQVAVSRGDLRARIHALQALGQIHRRRGHGLEPVLALLDDPEDEIRAQAARQLADLPSVDAAAAARLTAMLRDPAPRVRYFATRALGGQGKLGTVAAVADMLRTNRDEDVYLRHAGIVTLGHLATAGHRAEVFALAADDSASVRLAVVLVQRRLAATEIANFFLDRDPRIISEAVRAVHDLPIAAALPQLAELSSRLNDFNPATGRRILNARFRLGRVEDADALAAVATRDDVSPILRREALALLAEWPKPAPRERVTGAWAPLEPRSADPAIAAVRRVVPQLIEHAPGEVGAAAVGLAGQYRITEGIEAVVALANDPGRPDAARAAALRAMVHLADPRALELALSLLKASSVPLRIAARDLLAARDLAQGLTAYASVFGEGSLVEQQAALAALGGSVERRAFDFLIAQAEKVNTGALPVSLAVDVAEALERASNLTALSGQERNRRQLARGKSEDSWLARFPTTDPLRENRRALAGGDVERGRRLFHEKVEYLCIRCHRSEGGGTTDVGPDLTGIGERRSREYLLRAIVDPGAELAPGFEFATLTLQDGRVLAGAVREETATEITLAVDGDKAKPLAVKKREIAERRATSAMPALRPLMTERDLRDLVEYLAEARRPTP